MSRVDWRKRLAAPVAATALAAVLLLASQDFYFFRHKRLREQDQKVPPKIWLSMAVCFSSNTGFHSKAKFPYTLSARLAGKLWLNMTDVRTIIQVIYETKDAESEALSRYVKELVSDGNHVVTAIDTGDMPCSLRSQLQRMFVPESAFGLVSEDDLVVTSDVDTFVMRPDIFEELLEPQNLDKISILQYDNTIEYETTFAMVFISMQYWLWRELLNDEWTPEGVIERHRSGLGLGNYSGYTWDWDQKLLSRMILESGLCTVPGENKIWEMVRLAPPPTAFDDSKTCFHGFKKWTDCQSNKGPKKHPSGVCSRYHFHPEDTEQEVKRVFNAIISGKMPVQEAINTNMIFRHLERLYHKSTTMLL